MKSKLDIFRCWKEPSCQLWWIDVCRTFAFLCIKINYAQVISEIYLTHWLLELFAKKCGFFIFWWFLGFDLVENAFATPQLALLATSIAFYDIMTRACAEIKILRWPTSFSLRKQSSFFAPATRAGSEEGRLFSQANVFRLFDVWNFFPLSFFSFSFPFAAVIDLLLGFLAVKKTSKKVSSRRAELLRWSSQVCG